MAIATSTLTPRAVWWSAVRPATLAASVAPVLAGTAQVRSAAIGAFGAAALVGAALSLATDWRLLIAGAACVLAGWLYTGGPRPYGYLGLGELFVFVFFGLVATCGTVYVESLRITPLAILFGCSLGFLASAILVLNNLRDMESDTAAGKRTLATLIGRQRTLYLLTALTAAAFAIPIVAFMTHLAPVPGLAVPLAIPIATAPVPTAFAPAAPAR